MRTRRRMKALVFEAPKKMATRDLAVPEPGPQEVLVEVKAAGLCGTDIHIYNGDLWSKYPLIAGHEFAGEVVATGGEVSSVSRGTQIAVQPNVPCGSCAFCRERRAHLCRHLSAYGVGQNGGFAEYAVVKAENTYPIGDLSFEEGALIEPLSCALHGMSVAHVQPGDEVLIFGAGAIGLLLCQTTRLCGAARIASVDLSEEKLDFAKSLGADDTFVAKDKTHDTICRKYPGGFDVVIDATGVPGVVEALPSYAKDGGRLLYFGVCPKHAQISVSPFDVYRRELRIMGTFSLLAEFAPAIRLAQNGRVDLKAIVSHRFSLDEFRGAMKLMLTPKHRKILITSI